MPEFGRADFARVACEGMKESGCGAREGHKPPDRDPAVGAPGGINPPAWQVLLLAPSRERKARQQAVDRAPGSE